jgi:hypothetical protein
LVTTVSGSPRIADQRNPRGYEEISKNGVDDEDEKGGPQLLTE